MTNARNTPKSVIPNGAERSEESKVLAFQDSPHTDYFLLSTFFSSTISPPSTLVLENF